MTRYPWLLLTLFLTGCNPDSLVQLPVDGGDVVDRGPQPDIEMPPEPEPEEIPPMLANQRAFILYGESDSKLVINSEQVFPLTLLRSPQADCDPALFDQCQELLSETFTGPMVFNDTVDLNAEPAWFWLQGDGQTSNPVGTTALRPELEGDLQVLVFQGAIWRYGDGKIWRSADGDNWTLLDSDAQFLADREQFSATVHDGKIWIAGGKRYGNDVWVSEDGESWQEITQVTQFPDVRRHQLVSFKDQLWIIGGNSGGMSNDIYRSSDGANWQLVTTSNVFSAREGHGAIVYQDKLWVIGGDDVPGSIQRSDDVYSSVDGETWVLEQDSPGFSPRLGHQLVIFDDRLWVLGGFSNGYVSDIWSTEDGETWSRVDTHSYGTNGYHQVVTFEGQLYSYSQDFQLTSRNGSDWLEANRAAPFIARQGHQVTEFNGKLWLTGGADENQPYSDLKADLYSSKDGLEWQLESFDSAFGRRTGHQMLQFNEKMWIIGGQVHGEGDFSNSIWQSDDGVSWQSVSQIAPLPGIAMHQAAVFDEQIWIIGGMTDEGVTNQVWSSTDGATWTLRQDTPGFAPRLAHEVTVFNDRLWVLFGSDTNSATLDDIYSSADGINWQLEAEDTGLGRQGHQVVLHNGRLLMSGGYSQGGGYSREVYSSENGYSWSLETDSTRLPLIRNHQLISFDERVLMIGGDRRYSGSNDTYVSELGQTWYQAIPTEFVFPNVDPEARLEASAHISGPTDPVLPVSQVIKLDASGSDGKNYAELNYRWVMLERPDGSLAGLNSSDRMLNDFTPDLDGLYRVKLTVDDGQSQDSTELSFQVETPPTALVSGCSGTIPSGTTKTLDGSASYDEYNRPLTYTWSVSTPRWGGNGNLAVTDQPVISHTLTGDGNYNFTLVVSNGVLSSSVKHQCKVEDLPI